MSANTPAAAPDKSKKKLMIIIGVVAVLAIGGAAAWFMTRSHGGEDGEEGGARPAAHKESPKAAPTFLPMENMVVNLADPGGDRFAQVGITVEVDDAKTAEQVKQYMPAIRSGILMLISQRSASELLQREGKEKLANDILREVSRPLGYSVPRQRARPAARAQEDGEDDEEDDRPRRREYNPVRRVLFSSFIIQ